ncbi:hypothetical protein [Novosphingobium aquimarinum]|uniref:hypothetical protein n=1 Tax=Novosphingobium aquimarinum TaxID=2682494 RepID=UPI0012EC4727|nr:hypothetical protein [Novosphingobium aquimarinum]
MGQSAGFSSLSPSLLARKGGARPAMRSQVIPLDHLHDGSAQELHDDLGWNDMGEDRRDDYSAPIHTANVVPFERAAKQASTDEVSGISEGQSAALLRFASDAGPPLQRRAAFTLRLDPERHLKLRLASTMLGRSAQAIVTQALDLHLATMPAVAELAGTIRNRD